MPKILIIAPSWVGDAVMAQPLLRRLQQRRPDAVIDAFAPAWVAPVMARMPEIRRVIINPLTHGELRLGLRWKLGRALRRERYDQVVILPNSLKSALIPFFAGIPLRTGFKGEMRYSLVNDRRKLDKQALPLMVERFAALAEQPQASLRRPVENPRLTADENQVQTTLAKLGLAAKNPVAFCIGAEYGPAKRWPAAHFAGLARMLADKGHEIWLLGSAKEAVIGEEIELLSNGAAHNLCGKTDLTQAIDLLAAADIAVVNDSGLMHIAAALDKPTIALFGSSSPGFTPPLSDKARVVSLNLPCSPCFRRECPLGHFDCLTKLTPQRVFEEIAATLPRSAPEAPVTIRRNDAEVSALPERGDSAATTARRAFAGSNAVLTSRSANKPAAPLKAGQSKGFEFIEGLAKELSSKSLVFPTSVSVTMRIRSALSDPDASASKVAHIVGAEPVLSAHLLRLANSAAMNLGGKPVTDLHAAIPRLGYAQVRNIAIAIGMRQLTQASPQGEKDSRTEQLWKHCILVAALSYVLAKKLTRLNPDQAMLAGLLHEIGTFYILTRAQNYPDLFTDESALNDVIDQWHSEIGQAILENWEIPKEISDAIRNHEQFERTNYGPADLTDLVMVANILANQSTPGVLNTVDWQTLPAAFGRLKLDENTCNTVMQESAEEIELVSRMLD